MHRRRKNPLADNSNRSILGTNIKVKKRGIHAELRVAELVDILWLTVQGYAGQSISEYLFFPVINFSPVAIF
jgi:hypothetical protein